MERVDFKRLAFVEWLEFLCRVASCVFVVDSKTAGKTKNAAMLRLIDDSRKPFPLQLCSFLSVFLKQVLFQFAKQQTKKKAISEQMEEEMQELFEMVPDADECVELLEEA